MLKMLEKEARTALTSELRSRAAPALLALTLSALPTHSAAAENVKKEAPAASCYQVYETGQEALRNELRKVNLDEDRLKNELAKLDWYSRAKKNRSINYADEVQFILMFGPDLSESALDRRYSIDQRGIEADMKKAVGISSKIEESSLFGRCGVGGVMEYVRSIDPGFLIFYGFVASFALILVSAVILA